MPASTDRFVLTSHLAVGWLPNPDSSWHSLVIGSNEYHNFDWQPEEHDMPNYGHGKICYVEIPSCSRTHD